MFWASFEKLKNYLNCPRRYKFIYNDDYADKFRKINPDFVMGQHVHNTLKKIMSESPANITPKSAGQILRQEWRKNRTGFSSRDEEAQFGRRAEGMVLNVLKDKTKSKPKFLEHSLKVELTDEIKLSGRIDRIDVDKDGNFLIIDYKTGKFNPQFIDKSQLLVYAVLMFATMQVIPVSACFWYIEQNDRFEFSPSESDILATKDEIERTVKRIQLDENFTPTPCSVCKWCEFIDICPEGQKWKENEAVIPDEYKP